MNRTIKALEREAVAAFHRGESWNTYWESHGPDVAKAEPYNAARYRRLYLRLMALVTSGDTAGMIPVGSDDDAMPWNRDDSPAVSDTITHARLLDIPSITTADKLG